MPIVNFIMLRISHGAHLDGRNEVAGIRFQGAMRKAGHSKVSSHS